MPDSDQLVLAPPAHHNQRLFSDHHLDENLPAGQRWLALQDVAQPVMDDVADVFRRFKPSNNERQTEENLVMPILRLLGHTFEVQATLSTSEGPQRPDYVFYRNAEALDANKGQLLTDLLPEQGGIAVGDAKSWNRPLDIAIRQKSGDALSNKNPSYQIYFYMLHSGVTWGILTNWKQWRLYHKDTAHKLDHFYEVDLDELVQSGDIGRFLYFYAFFRRDAFDDGPLSLTAILRESVDYAQNVGTSLKAQVYDALRHIAQGFLDYAPNGLHPDPSTLKTIYDNSLILLYRLIFILYAEARELLPVRHSQPYREIYSLHAIKDAVAQDLDYGRNLLPSTALLWPRVAQLFDTINRGSPPLKVATFNGGLFDPTKHDFLAKNTVGDANLQQAIDKLARVNGEFVDYRDLSVRHMGTIYEGLLEYRLCPLDKPEDGWRTTLVNDKGERKATGSYYTPDHIVKYIVERAVGPVLERAVAGKQTDSEKIQAVLDVNVLDPAMGSGHFLVEATEFMARFLVDLAIAPEGKTQEEADLAFWKRRVAQSCVYGVDMNPLAVELAKLSLWLTTVAVDRPLSFLDHHLRPGNSLIGARLEHLRIKTIRTRRRKATGNSETNGQIALFADSAFAGKVSAAIGFMTRIEENAASSVADVKEQERLYGDLRVLLMGKYSRLLNLVTATQFGLIVEAWLRDSLVEYVLHNGVTAFAKFEKLLDEADMIATDNRFFHWELEFPEVYFDRHGRPLGDEGGFEAVVGNPPYVEHKQLAPYKAYFARDYPDVYSGVADLYTYFFARGVQQLRGNGVLAYISSGMFRRLKSGEPLRRYLASNTRIEELVDFAEQQVFAGAVTYPVITVLARRKPTPGETLVLRKASALMTTPGEIAEAPLPEGEAPWVFLAGGLRRVVDGWEGAITLREFVGSRVCRGITTGCNEAFVISQAKRDELVQRDPGCAAILQPYVRGEDLHPWYQDDVGLWLIFTRRGINIDAYPEVRAYLEQYRTQLEPEPAGWTGPEQWPGRKPGSYKWYEIQDSVDYHPVFGSSRIHSTKVSLYPAFSISEQPCYAGNTSYVIPLRDLNDGLYLLGLLNSRVCEFFCRNVFAPKANGYYEVQPDGLERMPIPSAKTGAAGKIANLAGRLTALAANRSAIADRARHRLTDLFAPDVTLSQKLSAWWDLDFTRLRAEIRKISNKTDIPVQERDQWEAWFAEQRAEHQHLTDEIIRLETGLNERVYALFKLTSDEIKLMEDSTKYKYGEV